PRDRPTHNRQLDSSLTSIPVLRRYPDPSKPNFALYRVAYRYLSRVWYNDPRWLHPVHANRNALIAPNIFRALRPRLRLPLQSLSRRIPQSDSRHRKSPIVSRLCPSTIG